MANDDKTTSGSAAADDLEKFLRFFWGPIAWMIEEMLNQYILRVVGRSTVGWEGPYISCIAARRSLT